MGNKCKRYKASLILMSLYIITFVYKFTFKNIFDTFSLVIIIVCLIIDLCIYLFGKIK